MNSNKLLFKLRGPAFLESKSSSPDRILPLTRRPVPHLLVWSPAGIGEIFRADRHARSRPSNTLRPLVGDSSLLFAHGARHQAYRDALGPALRGGQLDRYRPIIQAAAQQAVDELLSAGTVVVPAWTRELALRIIGHLVLGPHSSNAGDAEPELLTRFGDLVESVLGTPARTLRYRYPRVPGWMPSRRRTILRERDAIRADLHRRLDERAGRVDRPNNPGLAAELMAEHPSLGRLGDAEIVDQLMSLIFAGHETTASAIAWTLYWLERDGTIRADLRAELAASSADGSVAAELPLLDAVCREALRICPPATVAGNRVLTDDRELLGRPLRAGTTLTPCIYLAHRQPDVYHQPHRFDPNRFLNHKWSAQHYLPFGGGMHRCLGADLATLEMRMVIAAVVRRAELRCLNPKAGTPHQRGPAMGPAPTLTMAARPCSG